jgi:hypothetical protein
MNEKPAGRDADGLLNDQFAGRVRQWRRIEESLYHGRDETGNVVRKAKACRSRDASSANCGQRRQGSRGAPRDDDGLKRRPAPASRSQGH